MHSYVPCYQLLLVIPHVSTALLITTSPIQALDTNVSCYCGTFVCSYWLQWPHSCTFLILFVCVLCGEGVHVCVCACKRVYLVMPVVALSI